MNPFIPFSCQDSHNWIAWLGQALCGVSAPLSAPPDGFVAAHRILSSHGILPLLYIRLRDDPCWVSLSDEMRSALAGAFRSSAARSFLLEEELARISTAYPGLALLKGSALGRTVYGNAAVRPVSDLDLLALREEASTIQACWLPLGYAASGLAANGRIGRWVRRYRAELPFTTELPGCGRLLVELHWTLVEVPYYVDRIAAADLWRDASPAPGLPNLLVPRPAVLLAHACTHLAMHHSHDLRLIWLVDIDRLVRSDTLDWDEVIRIAEVWKIGFAIHTCLMTAFRWLGTPTPPGALDALAQLATDRISRRSWGLGDETAGRSWRKAMGSLATMRPDQALRYLMWLGMRAVLRPAEWLLLARQERSR
jgi:hypothetical protein